MNAVQKLLFNLFNNLGFSRKPIVQPISAIEHCTTKQQHDLYCDAEKPFISNN